jgi:hypothetical protein
MFSLFPKYAFAGAYEPKKKFDGIILAKSLFGGAPKPVVTPPAVMPTPDDEAVKAAKKRKQAAAMQSTGRQSTILTDYGNAEKLG